MLLSSAVVYWNPHYTSSFHWKVKSSEWSLWDSFYVKVIYCKVQGIASNILRNKSALVIWICTTFTCFQTLCLRKRGFLHETGFSLPHRYHFDGTSFESKELWFWLLEIKATAVIYIHTCTSKHLKWSWPLAHATQELVIATYDWH